jgi:hypothetical protein
MAIATFIRRNFDRLMGRELVERLESEPAARICEYGHAVYSGNNLCSYGHHAASKK